MPHASLASQVAVPSGTAKAASSHTAWQTRREHDLHLKRLKNVKGQLGVEKPKDYAHVRVNAKKQQMAREQEFQRDRENAILLKKLFDTVGRQSSVTEGSRDAEHQQKFENQLLGAAASRRKAQQRNIDVQNHALVKRIQSYESEYAPRRLQKDWDFLERSNISSGLKKQVLSLPLPPIKHQGMEEPYPSKYPLQGRRGQQDDSVSALLQQLLTKMRKEAQAKIQDKASAGMPLTAEEQRQLDLIEALEMIADGRLLTGEQQDLLQAVSLAKKLRAGYLLTDPEASFELLQRCPPPPELVSLPEYWMRVCELPQMSVVVDDVTREDILEKALERGLSPEGLIASFPQLLDEAD